MEDIMQAGREAGIAEADLKTLRENLMQPTRELVIQQAEAMGVPRDKIEEAIGPKPDLKTPYHKLTPAERKDILDRLEAEQDRLVGEQLRKLTMQESKRQDDIRRNARKRQKQARKKNR